MASLRIDIRTVSELLADAERYEHWAMRTDWNARLSANFRELAADARARAAALGSSADPGGR